MLPDRRLLFIILMILLASIPVAAQESLDDHPLMQMLALVPNIPQAHESLITFADYRAAEAARPGAAQPQSWTEWDALNDARDEAFPLWINAIPLSVPADLLNFLREYEQMPEVMGFDFFDIDRAIEFGQPPAQGIILGGDFDLAAIDAALSLREFTRNDLADVPVWCGPDGCEEGMKADFLGVEKANPFGGNLGRKEPTALIPGYLLNSADWFVLQSLVSTSQDVTTPVAELPRFRAAAEAITQEGTLVQAMFIHASEVNTFLPDLLRTDEQEPIYAFMKEYGELPPYELVVMADVATETERLAIVGLVYGNDGLAEMAAAELEARLATYISLRFRESLVEIMEERGAELESPTLFTSEDTGKTVVLIPIKLPIAPNEPDESGLYVHSARGYRWLVDMIFSRDVGWLATNIVLPE